MKSPLSLAQIKPEYHTRAAQMYMPPEYTAEKLKATRLRFAQLMQEADEEKTKEAAHAAVVARASSGLNVQPAKPYAPAAFRPNSTQIAPSVPRVLSKAEQASAAVAYSKAHSVSVVQALKTLGFAS